MKRKIIKFLYLLILPTLLTSCANNTVLIDDFTIEDAKKCARIYLREIENKESLTGYTLKINRYYGKIKNKYYVVSIEFKSNNSKNYQNINNVMTEVIGEYTFYWGFHFERNQGLMYFDNKAYSITEAYKLKLITKNDLRDYYFDIYNKYDGDPKNIVNYSFTNYIK